MKQSGFSLMEMMIVLLIMSIIAAATAPIVSKKMSKSASSSNSNPWVFIDTKGNAAFNMAGKDVTAVIGASKVPTGVSTRLYIDCGNDSAQITLGKGDTAANVTADPVNGRIGISNVSTIPEYSVAFGMNQEVTGKKTIAIGQAARALADRSIAIGTPQPQGSATTANELASLAIGSGAYANSMASIALGSGYSKGDYSIAIGSSASTGSEKSVAIGTSCWAAERGSIAIGPDSKAKNKESIAIGNNANASSSSEYAAGIAIGHNSVSKGSDAVALGPSASAQGQWSVAIGSGAKALHESSVAIAGTTRSSQQIVLGTADHTVYIPGNLVVGKVAYLGQDSLTAFTHIRYRTRDRNNSHFGTIECNSGGGRTNMITGAVDQQTSFSDRRLKNVGEKYTDGLDALKKLDFYHYTFKKDEAKTPHVGVIAQDLQKVFPNAVTKADDGYLTIRMEDMFYAVINAVKELDSRINTFVDDISGMKAKIDAQQKTIEALEKRLEELEKAKK